ncbi:MULTISPECIES: hypothetical protein [unclassified Agrococcus]|uniref:DUF7882 family protein n=1 Tax=unclassified Agrococcus TaxID=2615065 RepID=UPI00360B3B71
MGIFYAGDTEQRLSDADLQILQAVALVQRSVDEPFLATFVDLGDARDARRSHWITRRSALRFVYDDADLAPLDEWHLDLQLAEARSEAGMLLRCVVPQRSVVASPDPA